MRGNDTKIEDILTDFFSPRRWASRNPLALASFFLGWQDCGALAMPSGGARVL